MDLGRIAVRFADTARNALAFVAVIAARQPGLPPLSGSLGAG